MNNGIIITVFLPGRIGGSVSHTEKQTIRYDASRVGDRKPIWVSREIVHNDRPEQKCYKKVRISGELVEDWTGSTVPSWSSKKKWNKLNKNQRLVSYIAQFDEGFGVTFEEVWEKYCFY